MRARLTTFVLWLVLGFAGVASAVAEPVPGWNFVAWGSSEAAVKDGIAAAGLSVGPVTEREASWFALPGMPVTFSVPVAFYGKAAKAFPMFREDRLQAVRFVLDEPDKDCAAVLEGLTGDYGPGSKDPSFSNINWPTTDKFALTVPISKKICWPMFSAPGT
jgi:hypothetical protein